MIILHVAVTVDGFIAGPDHDMSWTGGAEHDTSSPLADEVARNTGAILAGRGWYEVARADDQGALAGIYGGDWSGPVVVITHEPDRIQAEPRLETATDLESGLRRAEELAGGRDLGVFGGDVARQLLALGRLDELVLQIVPIVLGGGVQIFGSGPAPRVALERTHVGTSGPFTDLRFRVVHSAPKSQ